MRFITALLISALSLAPASADPTSANDDTASVQGRYVRKGSKVDFLELRPGGVAFLSQGRHKIEGNYKVEGDKIILTSPVMPTAQVAQLRGNTITDPDGMIWEKQSDKTPASPPSGPSMKETEAWFKRQLPAMIKDRVVTKTSKATWAISSSVDKVTISDCRMVLRIAEHHESPPNWEPGLLNPAIRTVTFGDIDVSKIQVRESATAPDTTLSKPSYVVSLIARPDKEKPFVLEHHGQPPRSVASIGLRVSTEEMANELAGKLRHAALLCGAPDAPPVTPALTAAAAPSTAPGASVASNDTSTTAANPQPTPANAMTNAEVISMVTAGLSDDVISTAIRQAPSRAFDLTPTALIALKAKKVSDNVIAAMQAAANPAPAALPAAQPRPKYDASLAETAKPPAAPLPCAGVEMMGLYKNEIFDRAMGGGVVEWLAKIRNNTSVTKIVVFGWIDSYGQQKRSQVELGGGQIASPRVDLTQARYIAPARDLKLISCE